MSSEDDQTPEDQSDSTSSGGSDSSEPPELPEPDSDNFLVIKKSEDSQGYHLREGED